MRRIKCAVIFIMLISVFTGCNNSISEKQDEVVTTEIESTADSLKETSFESKEINEADPEEVIKEYVRCLGHDWDRFVNFHESGTVESWNDFIKYNLSGNVGILNVNNAELIDYMEVSFDEVMQYLSWPLEGYEGREVKAYVTLVNYSVNQPDPGFFNDGFAYDLYTLVNEDGAWKIREQLNIYEYQLEELGYVLGE